MAASTRADVNLDKNSPFTLPASNDTELDIEVAKVAEQQKRETGQSEDSAQIKSRLMGEGFKHDAKVPASVEEDMRETHKDTETAKEAEANAEPTFTADGEPNNPKKSSKK
jgi:hypothetical protein